MEPTYKPVKATVTVSAFIIRYWIIRAEWLLAQNITQPELRWPYALQLLELCMTVLPALEQANVIAPGPVDTLRVLLTRMREQLLGSKPRYLTTMDSETRILLDAIEMTASRIQRLEQ